MAIITIANTSSFQVFSFSRNHPVCSVNIMNGAVLYVYSNERFSFLSIRSFDDDSSVSSGDISDAIAEISTDDIQSGSSISYTSDNSSNHNPYT